MTEVVSTLEPSVREESGEHPPRLVFLQSHLKGVLETLAQAGDGSVPLILNRVRDAAGCDRYLAAPRPRRLPSSTMVRVRVRDGRRADSHSDESGLDGGEGELLITQDSVAGQIEGRALGMVEIIGPGIPVYTPQMAGVVNPFHWDDIRWRRSRGALGVQVWTRLQALRVVLVGVGRNGSLLAEQLVAAGVDHLTLVDPDFVEAATLGEGSLCFTKEDFGKAKAVVLAERLAGRSRTRLEADTRSVLAPALGPVLAGADLLVSALDNPAARLAVATMAARFLRVHLDVGSGVFSSGKSMEMGCDVRLSIPGEGCVACLGGSGVPVPEGINTIQRARSAPAWERTFPMDRSGRSGSLRSLNSIACGFGIRLLEDFLAGTVNTSTWVRLHFREWGELALQRVAAEQAASRTCPICGVAGWG